MPINNNSLQNLKKASEKNKTCKYCNLHFTPGNLVRHEPKCKINPQNYKICPVCKKSYNKDGKTCSYACANTFFRSNVNNPNWKNEAYRTTCFHHHGKKCIICGEEKIVEVHHINENHNDNAPENLIPLCPTHHQYVHSRFKKNVSDAIENYQKEFLKNQNKVSNNILSP